MGGKSKTKTKQKVDNSIDPWSKSQYEGTKNRVNGILDASPFQSYTGDRVAGLSDLEQMGANNYRASAGVANGILGQGIDVANSTYQGGPFEVSHQRLEGRDLSGYMNPYMDEVVDRTMNDMNLARERAITQGESGIHSSAFGGSRHGVSDALTNEAFAREAGNTAAGLRSGAYDRATGLALQDSAMDYDADKYNANLHEMYDRGQLSKAGLLGSMSGQYGQQEANEAAMLSSLGANDRAIKQAGLDATYNEFLRAQQDPFNRAQMQLGLLGTTPVIQDSYQQGTSTQKMNPGIGGVLGTGIGLASSLGWQPFK